jgi:hypothetical protein
MAGWNELEAALTGVLAEFADGTRLIVSWRGEDTVYVQAAQDLGQALLLEAVSDSFLTAPVNLGPAGGGVLTELGWTAPRGAGDNWSLQIAWPTTTRDFAHGAHLLVGALRDGYRVPSTEDLVYTAWREAVGADGDPDLEFLSLGIERVPPP